MSQRYESPCQLANGRLHDEAIALFQQRTKRKLTREDGREITKNLTGFIQVLLAWDRAERAAQPKELDHE